jgi:lipopolysaccharide export system protein LptC
LNSCGAQGYRFLVFSRKTGQPSYEATVVEQSDDKGASNYFIRKVAVSRFFNEESKRKFQVQAAEAILMVDSAETEYEADLYFWSNGRFQQQAVDE